MRSGNRTTVRTDIITTQPRRGAEAIFDRVRTATRRPRSRRERALALLREQATPRTLAMAGGALVGVAALAFVGRKLFWQAVAISADAVEEIADTIEDAAEDLSDAARARADGRESGSD
jgi:aryl-alcohol dehydrogenase-like predicted oxidoreductase